MTNTYLIITSIAGQDNPTLKHFAQECSVRSMPFIVVGDTKSPQNFKLEGCNFYSIAQQKSLDFSLASMLPEKHYARKNLGYLLAISQGAEVIIETDDDNLPLASFWSTRHRSTKTYLVENKGWVNVYKYFTDVNIWPRGFALDHIKDELPDLDRLIRIDCPIQQGLADDNPDVDAIYRFILPLPIKFNRSANVALGTNSFCPFNSQNTTWFKEAFPLLYLPSYCSFRMTDIWRSFVAQRIAWTYGWPILFHQSNVRQERNEHDLMFNFRDELDGYSNNAQIMESLQGLNLKSGNGHIANNMLICYQELVNLSLIGKQEMRLLESWLKDINKLWA